MCLDSYKSPFTKSVFRIKFPSKGFSLTVTNNSSSIVIKHLKDVLTCLEEPVWHLWLSWEGVGIKTKLRAWGVNLRNWNSRRSKKIYRKKQKSKKTHSSGSLSCWVPEEEATGTGFSNPRAGCYSLSQGQRNPTRNKVLMSPQQLRVAVTKWPQH